MRPRWSLQAVGSGTQQPYPVGTAADVHDQATWSVSHSVPGAAVESNQSNRPIAPVKRCTTATRIDTLTVWWWAQSRPERLGRPRGDERAARAREAYCDSRRGRCHRQPARRRAQRGRRPGHPGLPSHRAGPRGCGRAALRLAAAADNAGGRIGRRTGRGSDRRRGPRRRSVRRRTAEGAAARVRRTDRAPHCPAAAPSCASAAPARRTRCAPCAHPNAPISPPGATGSRSARSRAGTPSRSTASARTVSTTASRRCGS